jgi:polysaccharide biosynthesis transport protein
VLFPLLQEEQKLLEMRGENHVEVKALRQRIKIARDYLASPSAAWRQPKPNATNGDSIKQPIEEFRDFFAQQLKHVEITEKLVSELYGEEFATAKALGIYEVEDEKQRRDIAVTEKLLDSIVKKLEEVNLVKNVGGYDAKMIASPSVAKKVFPSALIVALVSVFAGGLFGFGLAYFAESRDKSFRNTDEIRVRLGLPIVGQIPFVKAPAPSGKLSADAPRLSPLLFAYQQPKSEEAEAYRSVRTALYFGIHGQGHKVVQVTSANCGDGKSTLAANLAISIAQSGKKVLLLDADMRKPTIHKLFGLSSQRGLSSVIAGQLEPPEAIQELSIPGLSGLSIVPCGPIPPNSAELLMSRRFVELLNYLRERFDFVVIDSPSLLAVTDPSIVAHHVDGVFLNIRFSKNGRTDAQRAKDVLSQLKANIIGVVVSDSESMLKISGYRHGLSEDTYHANGSAAPTAEAQT